MTGKEFLLWILAALVVCSTGCSDDYGAEKEMWHAQRAVKEILVNIESTPPGQFELAANRFRKIIEKYPKWPGAVKAQWAIPEIYIAQKNYSQAEIELEKIITRYSENKDLSAQAKVTIGSLYEMQKDWDSALKVYHQLIEEYPQTSQALNMFFYIANRYRGKGDYTKAASFYLEAVNKYNSIIIKGTAEDKVKFLAKGLKIKTEFALATLYEKEGRWAEALPLLNKIKAEYPYSQEGLGIPLYIANHYKVRGEETQAEAAFSETLNYYQGIYRKNEENPLGLISLNLITNLYLNQKKWTEALKIQEKIVEKYPKAPDVPLVLLNIGVINERMLKNEDEAIEAYKKLIEKYPRHRVAQTARKRIEELK